MADRTKSRRTLRDLPPAERGQVIDISIEAAQTLIREHGSEIATEPHGAPGHDPDCPVCGLNKPFELPANLVNELGKGTVVLFAGAGVSEPMPPSYNVTFYDSVYDHLGVENENLSFPELMSRLCEEPNGRIKLLELVKQHFDRIDGFDELRNYATRFHDLLASIFEIDTIITTNWDCYFEEYTGAIPFVTAPDFSFWNYPGRKVIKIHGSLANIGSIVATKEDYERCQGELLTSVVGSTIKLLFATKTIVYVGYSARDPDFLYVHNAVRNEMPGLTRQSYIVTHDDSDDDRLKELGMIPIHTDAWHFVNRLRVEAEKTGHHLPEERLGLVALLRRLRIDCHQWLYDRYDFTKYPQVLYCAFYQDGLQHGVEQIFNCRKTGKSTHLCEAIKVIRTYGDLRKEKVSKRQYENVAYIDGYINAFKFLFSLCEPREAVLPPLFYVYGGKTQPRNCKEYASAMKKAPALHGSAHRAAERNAARYKNRPRVSPHHPPKL